MTILPQLERDLFEAAQKRLPAADDRAAEPLALNGDARPREPRARITVAPTAGTPRPGGRSIRPSFGSVVAVFSVVVSVAIAGLAVVLLGHTHKAHNPSPANRTPQPAVLAVHRVTTLKQLLAQFAVLRRAQTAADRSWKPSGEAGGSRQTRPLPNLTRLATTLDNGQRVFLTVEQSLVAQGFQAAGSYSLSLWLVSRNRIIGGEPYSASVGHTIFPGPLAFVDHKETWTSIVPDAVKSVRWVFPRQNGLRTHVYPRPLTVDVPVVDNVAAARVPRSATWEPVTIIWEGTNGKHLETYKHADPKKVLPPLISILTGAPVQKALAGDGIGNVKFGDPPATVTRYVTALLGAASDAYYRDGTCGADHAISWPGLLIFFRNGKFVGYQYGTTQAPARMQVQAPVLTTTGGLRIGHNVAQAERLYGGRFHLITGKDGSWSATTPTGRIEGTTWPPPRHGGVTSSRSEIATIVAGVPQCPATAP